MICVIACTNRPNSNSLKIAEYYIKRLQAERAECMLIDLNKIPETFLFSALYDNQGKEVFDMDFTTTHADHFKIHEKRGHKARNVTKSVIHRIKTTHSLQVLRRSVKTILNTNQCQVIYHHWKETEPDIIQLGHIIGIHPNHHSQEEAQALVAKSITDATMPPFCLVYSTPSISTTTGESRTKAYALKILRKD